MGWIEQELEGARGAMAMEDGHKRLMQLRWPPGRTKDARKGNAKTSRTRGTGGHSTIRGNDVMRGASRWGAAA